MNENNRAVRNFQSVSDSLKRLNFKFFPDMDNLTIRLGFTTPTLTYEGAVACGENYVSVSVRYPFTVGDGDIQNTLRLINSINTGNPVGHIELWEDFKTLVVKNGIHAEAPPTDDVVHFLLLRAISLAETNAKKVMELLLAPK